MPRNINMLAPCLGQRQVIRGNPRYQPPHGPAKASGRSGAQLRGLVERTSIPSPPLASTHRLSRRWHGERPPTMRTTPALLLLAASCGPIPPTDTSSTESPTTDSSGDGSMGASSEVGSTSTPPSDSTSMASSGEATSAGSTSTGPITTSASSGGDSSTSDGDSTSSTGEESGSSSGGSSDPCGRCADGRVCAEHPDTGVPWCVAPCGPSLVCPTVGGLEFECLDGLCFPVL